MSELEFLNALRVEVVRHGELRPEARGHELFQTSTIEALLAGACDGDVSLSEILQHGDLGLRTLNGLDGELTVIDGQAWKADRDCRLIRAPSSSRTPYAVVVPFSTGASVTLRGALQYVALGKAVGHRLQGTIRPVAVRIDGRFEHVRVRSVPKQRRPYPQLAEALAQQCISDLHDLPGTRSDSASLTRSTASIGWDLHFANDARTRGGHVLDFALRDGIAHLHDATELQVELPPAVEVPNQAVGDHDALRRLESDGER